MLINEKKTKSMIFNFTKNYQFSTRLKLKNESLEIVENTKLLGTIVQNDLKWDLNTANLVKKCYARLELLRRVASFSPSREDLKNIYILFVRSVLEQSAIVWHSSLTVENSNDLERIQKCAMKIILQENYIEYEEALNQLDIEKLYERREQLCLKVALKCIKNPKTQNMFPVNKNSQNIPIREREKYQVQFARTAKLQNSAIIHMQNMLNLHEASSNSPS